MSHSPRPWKLKGAGSIYSDEQLVATTGYQVRVGDTTDEDNARLIAAAPELLAACEAVLRHLPSERAHECRMPIGLCDVEPERDMHIAYLEEVIAKAKGGAQ